MIFFFFKGPLFITIYGVDSAPLFLQRTLIEDTAYFGVESARLAIHPVCGWDSILRQSDRRWFVDSITKKGSAGYIFQGTRYLAFANHIHYLLCTQYLV